MFLQCQDPQNQVDLGVEDSEGGLYCCSLYDMYEYGKYVHVDFKIDEDSHSGYISEVVTSLVKCCEQKLKMRLKTVESRLIT